MEAARTAARADGAEYERRVRRMGVLNPVRVVIDNFPEDAVEWFDAVNNPEDPNAGTRKIPFTRELLIERDDFMEDPPKKFFRLAPDREVRLRYACLFKCTGVEKDADSRLSIPGKPVLNRTVTLKDSWAKA